MTSEEERVLAAWLCAGCYGRYFIAGYDSGVVSNIDTTVSRSATITVSAGATTFVAVSRQHGKTSQYHHRFFDAHALISSLDSTYASFWSYLHGGQTCWGDVHDEWDGAYSSALQYTNSQIYYADLREDIVVYYQEEGSQSLEGSGSSPIGRQKLAYGYFDGAGDGCKRVNILDAIKIPVSSSVPTVKKELVTIMGYETYRESATKDIAVNAAASDYSGYAGGVAYGSYVWGNYAAIDEAQPYDCTTGDYEELASPEHLDGFYNSWDDFGTYSRMDEYDMSIWNQNCINEGLDRLPNGTYAYPSFLEIETLPRGSWCVDGKDNYFVSQITRDSKVFNKLNTLNPTDISGLASDDDPETEDAIVYYPVGVS